jgi:hypothetical protein
MTAEILNLNDYREKEISDEQINRLIFGPIVEAHLGDFDAAETAKKVIEREKGNE